MSILIDNLEHIEIRGDNKRFVVASLVRFAREGTDNVVSFVVIKLDEVPAEVTNEFLEERNLSIEIFARLYTSGFILWVEGAALTSGSL